MKEKKSEQNKKVLPQEDTVTRQKGGKSTQRTKGLCKRTVLLRAAMDSMLEMMETELRID